jgi:surface-anchored protein
MMKTKPYLKTMLLSLLLAAPTAQSTCTRMQSDIVTFHFGVEAQRPDPNVMETIDLRHTDLDMPYVCDANDCRWDFAVSPNDQPGGGDRMIPPDAALLYVNSLARMTMPSNPAYTFLGAAPGQTVWILPQNYVSGVLWLGLSSERTPQQVKHHLCLWDPNDPRGGANTPALWLRVELIDVRGPAGGHLSMWQTGTFGGPTVYFSTFDGGITDRDVFHLGVGAHAHANWGFTHPGVYDIDLRVSTTYRCDTSLTADLNGDCRVSLDDAAILARHWLYTECAAPTGCDGDLAGSGQVDLDDLFELAHQWLLCGSPFASECP